MDYNIHPKIIDLIIKIYTEDSTKLFLNGLKQTEIKIMNGIRQGCNALTFLFIILTYNIITKLEKLGVGFQDECFKIPILYFADDSLLLSHSIEEITESINYVQQIAEKYGLEINKEKSEILIYSIREQPVNIENIQATICNI